MDGWGWMRRRRGKGEGQGTWQKHFACRKSCVSPSRMQRKAIKKEFKWRLLLQIRCQHQQHSLTHTHTTLAHTHTLTHTHLKSGTQNNKLINIFNHISIKYCVCFKSELPLPVAPPRCPHPSSRTMANRNRNGKLSLFVALAFCTIFHSPAFPSPRTSTPQRMPKRAGHTRWGSKSHALACASV